MLRIHSRRSRTMIVAVSRSNTKWRAGVPSDRPKRPAWLLGRRLQ
jgi:hypothetical protein